MKAGNKRVNERGLELLRGTLRQRSFRRRMRHSFWWMKWFSRLCSTQTSSFSSFFAVSISYRLHCNWVKRFPKFNLTRLRKLSNVTHLVMLPQLLDCLCSSFLPIFDALPSQSHADLQFFLGQSFSKNTVKFVSSLFLQLVNKKRADSDKSYSHVFRGPYVSQDSPIFPLCIYKP